MQRYDDVITAWTLALYIVTAAAGKLDLREISMDVLMLFSFDCVDGYYWEPERYLRVVLTQVLYCVMFLNSIIPQELTATKLRTFQMWRRGMLHGNAYMDYKPSN